MTAFSAWIRRGLARFGYNIVRCRRDNGFPLDFTDEDVDLTRFSEPYTMTSPERVRCLVDAVDYVVAAKIPGDFVECGVWRGGSMMIAAKALLTRNDRSRDLWLYDTFEGMTRPTDADVSRSGVRALGKYLKRAGNDGGSNWCAAGIDDVRNNLISTGYPASKIRFVKGDVALTLRKETPDKISVLRLDTDWYESTKVELEILFPKVSPGGLVIIDDYGSWNGARKAVDEYFSKSGARVFLSRIDDAARVAVKR